MDVLACCMLFLGVALAAPQVYKPIKAYAAPAYHAYAAPAYAYQAAPAYHAYAAPAYGYHAAPAYKAYAAPAYPYAAPQHYAAPVYKPHAYAAPAYKAYAAPHYAAPHYPAPQYAAGKPIAILKSSDNSNYDGSYNYDFESEDGISVQSGGYLKPEGPEGTQVAQGAYSYVSPDGTPITTRWYADESGFHAEGEHLPVAPPVPEAIAKSLAYQASLPPVVESARRL